MRNKSKMSLLIRQNRNRCHETANRDKRKQRKSRSIFLNTGHHLNLLELKIFYDFIYAVLTFVWHIGFMLNSEMDLHTNPKRLFDGVAYAFLKLHWPLGKNSRIYKCVCLLAVRSVICIDNELCKNKLYFLFGRISSQRIIKRRSPTHQIVI